MMDIAALAWPVGRTDLKAFNGMPAFASQDFSTPLGATSMRLFTGSMNLGGRGFGFNDCVPGGPDSPDGGGSGGAVIYGG
jgi:hypothetical protein